MPSEELRLKLDEALKQVQTVAAVGDQSQIRSVMRVPAVCAEVVAEGMEETASAIDRFNRSATAIYEATTELSRQVVVLNRRLLIATWIIAGATAVAAVAAVVSAFSKS